MTNQLNFYSYNQSMNSKKTSTSAIPFISFHEGKGFKLS